LSYRQVQCWSVNCMSPVPSVAVLSVKRCYCSSSDQKLFVQRQLALSIACLTGCLLLRVFALTLSKFLKCYGTVKYYKNSLRINSLAFTDLQKLTAKNPCKQKARKYRKLRAFKFQTLGLNNRY